VAEIQVKRVRLNKMKKNMVTTMMRKKIIMEKTMVTRMSLFKMRKI